MGKRIFSTVLLWGIVAAALWFYRTNGAIVLITIISVFTLREFYKLMEGAGYDPFQWSGILLGGLITLSPWLEARHGWRSDLLLPLVVIFFCVRLLAERLPLTRVETLAFSVLGVVYVGLMLRYLVAIVLPLPGDAISPDGRLLLCLWLVAVTKFCDMGALLTGMAIGRHPMAPIISPKKTWEGAAGGVVLSMLIGALIAWLARNQFPPHLTPLRAALFAAPIAMIGIVADLVESVMKRRAAMKDSGASVPGIGGMFDLSDSLLLAAPVGYFLFRLP